jgi:hypothetical protein
MQYWIFQGNPKKYDVDGYLQKYDYVYWGLKQHEDKILKGDTVFFWRAQGGTKNPYGLIAKGIIKEPKVLRNQIKYPKNLGNEFWEEEFTVYEVVSGVQIVETRHTPGDGMMTSDLIKSDNLLTNLQIVKVKTGTNFLISEKEGKHIDKLWNQQSKGNPDWTEEEITSIVSDYFSMLSKELDEAPYNKSEHRRSLKGLLNNRSDGSIEFKHQNISAVLVELGCPYIDGYKPRYNYQSSLIDLIGSYLDDNQILYEKFTSINKKDPQSSYKKDKSILDCLTDPPDPKPPKKRKPINWESKTGTKKDYLGQDSKNEKLGKSGEEFVVDYEKMRLKVAGKPELAEKVEHVSQTKGDGLGYDVLSFNDDGSVRWIEVKTTNYGKSYPFPIEWTEVQCSIDNPDKFYLYRVYNFRNQDRGLYYLKGSVEENFELKPKTYIASVRNNTKN